MPLRRSPMYTDKKSYIESVRLDANALCQNQFIATTDARRMKSGTAQSLTKLWTHEKNLQQRRERLRGLLSMEATLYQKQLLNDCKTKAEDDFKLRESRLLGLRAERERQRLKFVEEMRVQQLINSCDELRPYLRQKLQDDCKNCQQRQIDDNNLRKMEKLDENRLWHDVQNQVFDQMTQREREESSVAQRRNVEEQQILREQMLDKNEITKEVEQEQDTMHCGKVFDNAPTEWELAVRNKEKQRQFAQDLLSQRTAKDLAKTTLRNCDIAHDLTSIRISLKEMKMAEQIALMEKKQKMKETLHFLEYKKSLDKGQKQAEQEMDILVDAMRNEKNNEYLKNRSYFNQQRDQFNKSIYEERWKQITDRRQKLVQEKNQKINEIIEANEIFANNANMESESLRKKKIFRLHYGHDLRAQCNYEKLEKDKAAISSNQLTEIIKKDEAHKTELIKGNLGRIHEIYPLHPNYKAILSSEK